MKLVAAGVIAPQAVVARAHAPGVAQGSLGLAQMDSASVCDASSLAQIIPGLALTSSVPAGDALGVERVVPSVVQVIPGFAQVIPGVAQPLDPSLLPLCPPQAVAGPVGTSLPMFQLAFESVSTLAKSMIAALQVAAPLFRRTTSAPVGLPRVPVAPALSSPKEDVAVDGPLRPVARGPGSHGLGVLACGIYPCS